MSELGLTIRPAQPQDAVVAGLAEFRHLESLLKPANATNQAATGLASKPIGNSSDLQTEAQATIEKWDRLIEGIPHGNRVAVAVMNKRIVGSAAVTYTSQLGRSIVAVREHELAGLWVDELALTELGFHDEAPTEPHFRPLWETAATSFQEIPSADSPAPVAGNSVARQIRQRLLDYVLPALGPAQTWVHTADRVTWDFLRSQAFIPDGMARIESEWGQNQERLVR
ncbi:hypothetical protein BSR28_07400 [Boudabousia liubingyangii]|uniref:hypothetical protein n=1 Tax=Boudabousia liubingyangii TaxID=1921764 RepID=UPI00093C0450|nr:hypothetical protein [Boudabousia liubingyangii]OKL46349.1 hypothetical protein BSR28_07400 [Boudabousia liubingyangii]